MDIIRSVMSESTFWSILLFLHFLMAVALLAAVTLQAVTALIPARQTAGPCHAQLTDIAFVDLIERAEALLVIGPAHHQPIGRIGIVQHRIRYRNEVLRRSAGIGRSHQCGGAEVL